MNSKINIFYAIALIIFLLLPQFGILFNVPGEEANLQNRTLQPFPEMSANAFLTASFGEQMNEYIWDHLPLRAQLIRADHWIDYYVFRDSPVPEKVLLGKGEWLFLYDAVINSPIKNERIIKKFLNLSRRATQLQKDLDMEIVIVPSPSKASIYPEYLPDYLREIYTGYARPYHDRLEVAAATDAKSLLLLWEPFLLEKERLLNDDQLCADAKESTCFLFRPRDRHFSWETSIFQAEQIVERLAPEKWKDDIYKNYLTELKLDQSELERRFVKVNLPESYISLDTDGLLNALSIKLDVSIVGGTYGKMHVFEVEDHAEIEPIPKRVVIIHDSFMRQSMYLIAPYFQETIFLHWDTSENMSIFSNTIQDTDILVIEAVEDQWFLRLKTLSQTLAYLSEDGE